MLEQTNHARCLTFSMKGHMVTLAGTTEAIFHFSSWMPRYGHIGFLRDQIGVQKMLILGLYLGS